jgi:putative chitinase
MSVVGLQKPDEFYAHIGQLFPPTLSNKAGLAVSQREGIDIDLHMGAGVLPLGWMAYCLATDYHETNKTMQPVREAYWLSEDWRKRHLSYYPWYGRGKVQLTWLNNYVNATKRLRELGYEVDFVKDPDQALELTPAAVVLTIGMLEGWFSGKKLRDFIGRVPDRNQYIHARQIINGLDRAELVAGYATVFEQALTLGEWI